MADTECSSEAGSPRGWCCRGPHTLPLISELRNRKRQGGESACAWNSMELHGMRRRSPLSKEGSKQPLEMNGVLLLSDPDQSAAKYQNDRHTTNDLLFML